MSYAVAVQNNLDQERNKMIDFATNYGLMSLGYFVVAYVGQARKLVTGKPGYLHLLLISLVTGANLLVTLSLLGVSLYPSPLPIERLATTWFFYLGLGVASAIYHWLIVPEQDKD